jgi:hypothetical protein
MQLTLGNDIKEIGLVRIVRIWKLGADAGIYILGTAGFVLRCHNEKDVGMRKTALLELHHPSPAQGFTQDATLRQVFHELAEFDIEDSRHNVGSIVGTLAR